MISLLLLLSACERPGLPELSDGPHRVTAQVLWTVELDAHQPTDVLSTPDGGLWVLDSYDQQIQRFDARQQPLPPLSLPSWTRPSRLAVAAQGGAWLADPLGNLVRIDAQGDLQAPLDLASLGEGAAPVAALEHQGRLFVADRHGGVDVIDATTGALLRSVDQDADGRPVRLVTDLLIGPTGEVLLIDTLRTAVHVLGEEGVTSSWGHFGMWAGALMKPKSAALAPEGTVLVADTALDVLQLFDDQGHAIGMVATADGQVLRPGHPIAVDAVGVDEFLVLDASVPSVTRLRIPAEEIRAATERSRTTHALRHPLREDQGQGVAGAQGDTCLQCHDGLVLDDRQVWQDDLDHHPVDVVPDYEVPAFFPLDDQGRLRCTTCHSPHGASSATDAAAVADEEGRLATARHWSDDEFFTRLERGDSALCEACHTDAAHDDAIDRLGLSGSTHPVGSALEDALAKRAAEQGSPLDDVQKGCLGCHSPHAAEGKALLRAAGDGKGCIACHEGHADSRRSHPVGAAGDRPRVREASQIPVDREGQVDCSSCHQLVGGSADQLLRSPADGGDLCVACHDERVKMLSGPHGRVPGAHGTPCLGCHDVHDEPSDALLTTMVGGPADPNGCLDCHGRGKKHAVRGQSPGERGHPVDGKLHDSGDSGTKDSGTKDSGSKDSGQQPLTCASCHDAHRPEPISCDGCHLEQVAERDRGGHGKATCLDCHPAHQDRPLARETDHNPRSWTCLACHGEEHGRAGVTRVAEFEHPAPVFEPDGTRWEPLGGLPLFAPDGTTQPQGVNGEMGCMTCHMVHGPDPTEPKAKLKRPGWEKPCAACHGDNALALYRYFHQPDRRSGIDTKGR